MPNLEVLVRGMAIGLVISKLVFSWDPKNYKLDLNSAVLVPVKIHVYGFLSFLLEFALGEVLHSGVVNLDLNGRLWVPHIDEAGSQGGSILSIDVGGKYFGLGR